MSRTIAVFDVDGTLVPKPSTEVRFARFLVGRGLLGPRRLGAYIARLPSRLWREGMLAFKTNKAYLAGLDALRLRALAGEFLGEVGDGLWNQEVRSRLRRHQDAGNAVVLLTGTPDFLADVLAARLGVDGWEATVLPTRDGRVTASPVLQHPRGETKLAIARRMAEALGTDLPEGWAYGDSWADRYLLAAVAHPVVVGPDRRLGRLARERAWETVAAQA